MRTPNVIFGAFGRLSDSDAIKRCGVGLRAARSVRGEDRPLWRQTDARLRAILTSQAPSTFDPEAFDVQARTKSSLAVPVSSGVRAIFAPRRPERMMRELPGQVVLVLQGGGALGAYQLGVYEALHDAGIEPNWVIGTSIGAINAALIAGNAPGLRLERLREFWQRIEQRVPGGDGFDWLGLGPLATTMTTLTRGIPAFFAPNLASWHGLRAEVGVERAAYYSTAPLRRTLGELLDFDALGADGIRLTVGAVKVLSGAMRYFDSRDETLGIDHVLASGALPPAFPAVRIDGEPYWDGGLYSNTPIEAVLDDNPRRDALIFAVNVWHPAGREPESIWQVMGRQKDIQYASRADSHIARQKQIHRLRHVIRELASQIPPHQQAERRIRELVAWGCGTTMHIAHLVAPRVDGEDHTKDIDFTPAGVRVRRAAGYADTLRMIERAPWREPADPIEGIVEYH